MVCFDVGSRRGEFEVFSLNQNAGYQDAKQFYNGVTQKDIESSGVLGIDGKRLDPLHL